MLRLCPEIGSYAAAGRPADWREFVAAANLVRGFLGVSGDAWARAREAIGEVEAAVAVACMLERSERIRSPGGYLRDLTARAKRGAFCVRPMLRTLRIE